MAKIIETSQTGLTRFFAGFRRRHPYRWYEVEVACLQTSLIEYSGSPRCTLFIDEVPFAVAAWRSWRQFAELPRW